MTGDAVDTGLFMRWMTSFMMLRAVLCCIVLCCAMLLVAHYRHVEISKGPSIHTSRYRRDIRFRSTER